MEPKSIFQTFLGKAMLNVSETATDTRLRKYAAAAAAALPDIVEAK